MALSPDDRRILSQAREIILRHSLDAQQQLGQLAELQHWAAMIMATADDPVARRSAGSAYGLANDAAIRIERQDRHAMSAIDHIDDLIPPRD